MIIKNFTQLASSIPRKQVLRILESGLEAINTERIMKKQFSYDSKKDILYLNHQPVDLKPFKNIVVVGAGKLVGSAAEQIESQMLNRISGGLVIDIVPASLKKIASRVGTHPLPSNSNVSSTEEIIAMLNNLTEDDLVLAIIGGGGSSLLCSPKTVSLQEEREIIQALMDSGAAIEEMNTVRKHLSRVKGGGLAKLAYPATVISLIFSDVPGNDLSNVASGPTVMDKTTMEDAIKIINKYNILDRCSMDSCGLIETPKDLKYFAKVKNIMLCNSDIALQAMKNTAQDLGLTVRIWDSAYTGEAKELGNKILQSTSDGECLIAAGESVVTIPANTKIKGSGGRNQEMALAALINIPKNTVFATLASDGHDNSDVAGCLVDISNLSFAKQKQVNLKEALSNHDEYRVMLDINAAILTGITNSNISDLVVCLKY